MTLTIDLAPEFEIRLEQEANRHGVDPTEYVRRLIENALPSIAPNRLPPAEWEAILDAMARGHENLPKLSPEAYTRESIYGDRA